MLFNGVQFSGGWLGTARLVFHRVRRGELIGVRIRPPIVDRILTDKQLQQVAAVVVGGHLHLIPGDGHFVSSARRGNIFRRTVHVAPDGLQVEFFEGESFHVADHINDRGGDPAEIIEFVELDIQPVTVHVAVAGCADIARIQVCGVEISNGRTIPAMCLFVDRDGRERKCWCRGDG